MEAHEIYLGYMAICVGLGVALGLAAIALQLALYGIAYLGLFTWIAIETTMNTLPPLVLGAADRLMRAATNAAIHQWRLVTGQISTGVTIGTAPPAFEEPEPELIIPMIKDWESACMLLGLPIDGFSKQELSDAYRIAMRAAHPDRGGHPEMAKAFNIARDLIRDIQAKNEGDMT